MRFPTVETHALLSVNNLTIEIDHSSHSFYAIQDICFTIQLGETLALVGESGSGKTMTALAILGLLPKRGRLIRGEIKFADQRVTEKGEFSYKHLRGKHIAMIFQDAPAALNPVFQVGTQITDVIKTHLKLRSKSAKERTYALLEKVGFSQPEVIYRAYPHQLSGGMAQRIFIAMALSCEPQIIIADEPTSAVDVSIQKQILKLIKDLQRQHQFALLLISHDIGLVRALSDSVIVMKTGKIVERGETKQLLAAPEHSYTQTLIDSIFQMPTRVNEDTCKCKIVKYF